MQDFLVNSAPEAVMVLLSALAVAVGLFRARAQQTQAEAAAVAELAATSQDLRQRIDMLEAQNREKDAQIRDLRRRAAHIPTLDAQIRYLTDELAQVKGKHTDERKALIAQLKVKDREIARLRQVLNRQDAS